MARTIRRGEIYRMKRDVAGKPRPVLVVSRVQLNTGTTLTVVPFTSQQLDRRKGKPNNVFFNAGEGGLDEDCVAKCGDVFTVEIMEINMVAGMVGSLNESQLKEIDAALKWSLGLDDGR